MRTAEVLRDELLLRTGVVVTDVPYNLAGDANGYSDMSLKATQAPPG